MTGHNRSQIFPSETILRPQPGQEGALPEPPRLPSRNKPPLSVRRSLGSSPSVYLSTASTETATTAAIVNGHLCLVFCCSSVVVLPHNQDRYIFLSLLHPQSLLAAFSSRLPLCLSYWALQVTTLLQSLRAQVGVSLVWAERSGGAKPVGRQAATGILIYYLISTCSLHIGLHQAGWPERLVTGRDRWCLSGTATNSHIPPESFPLPLTHLLHLTLIRCSRWLPSRVVRRLDTSGRYPWVGSFWPNKHRNSVHCHCAYPR